MLTAETRLVRIADILFSDVDDTLVMMDVKTGLYFNLDQIGKDIWRRLETPCSLGELCTALGLSYNADIETITSDTRKFVEKMLEYGLLQQAR